MTPKRQIATKFNALIFGFMVFLFSCEKENIYQSGSIIMDELEDVYYAEETTTLYSQSEGLSKIIWQISDGSVYEGATIQHVFSQSGNYNIKLLGYYNNQIIDSNSYTVQVKYKSRSLKLDNAFYAIRGTMIDSKTIIIEGLFEGENSTQYLEFDKKLNFLGLYDSPADLRANTFYDIQLGNEVFSLNNGSYVVNNNLLKSSTEFIVPEAYFSQEVIKYSNGLIHYHHDNESNFLVDYYNSDLTKLWTKTFSGINKTETKFVFNNQDKLYYISFEDTGDKLFVEKFKNVSLYYQNKSFELGIDAADREILFAVYKPYTKTIDLAIYSKKTGSSYFFSIDENCGLTKKGKIDNHISGRVTYTLTNGATFIKNPDKIMKFDNTWAQSKEKVFSASYFDMFQLGDNQYLVCETINNSIRLSFFDKHLNQVIFE